MKAHVVESGLITGTIVVKALNDRPNLISGDIGGIGDLVDANGKITRGTPPPVVEVLTTAEKLDILIDTLAAKK